MGPLMSKDLKKIGSGNLFTVFGEPALALKQFGDQWTATALGIEVYNPRSGEVRANYLGDHNPNRSLKGVLKAESDEEPWATVNRSASVAFKTRSLGKIALKIIDDHGDEVMMVLETD